MVCTRKPRLFHALRMKNIWQLWFSSRVKITLGKIIFFNILIAWNNRSFKVWSSKPFFVAANFNFVSYYAIDVPYCCRIVTQKQVRCIWCCGRCRLLIGMRTGQALIGLSLTYDFFCKLELGLWPFIGLFLWLRRTYLKVWSESLFKGLLHIKIIKHSILSTSK